MVGEPKLTNRRSIFKQNLCLRNTVKAVTYVFSDGAFQAMYSSSERLFRLLSWVPLRSRLVSFRDGGGLMQTLGFEDSLRIKNDANLFFATASFCSNSLCELFSFNHRHLPQKSSSRAIGLYKFVFRILKRPRFSDSSLNSSSISDKQF